MSELSICSDLSRQYIKKCFKWVCEGLPNTTYLPKYFIANRIDERPLILWAPAFCGNANEATLRLAIINRNKVWQTECNLWDRLPAKTEVVPGISFFGTETSTGMHILTCLGYVTHICVGRLNIIVSYNSLSPGRRQAIIWTNAGILLIGPLGINYSEINNFYLIKCI